MRPDRTIPAAERAGIFHQRLHRRDRRCDAAAESRARSRSPAAREPALDRPDRPAQVPRGLLVGQALEVAEHHRRAATFGQPVDLLVQQGQQLVVAVGGRDLVGGLGRAPFQATRRRGRRSAPAPRSDRRPDAARGRANPRPRAPRPAAPGPGTWPGTRPRRHAGRPGRRGRPAGPSGRAARPGPRRPARPPRPGRSRTAPGAGSRSARR